jgi:ArsR family transcriptional regulator, lead/cadmium/zinc/bismuth-responsive transcriptional repressor
MHLLPADRAHRRIIDEDKVCEAIDSLADPVTVCTWAERFALLGDPTRLRLLICINAAGPISVSDLAAAADMNSDAVSQTLRLLRASHTVTTQRDGRIIRYRLADPIIHELLNLATSASG